MTQYGIFNDESANYTENESIEAGFYSREEAEQAILDRYPDDDSLEVHTIEEVDEDEDEDE